MFMEDLDYRTSAKGMFGKHMLDAAFGRSVAGGSFPPQTSFQFRQIVKYVCSKRGKFFASVDARGTSQECPECGSAVKKDLSVRVHHCPSCGYTTDRDVASGQVIRNRGIAKAALWGKIPPQTCRLISTAGLAGKETRCADDLPGVGVTQSRQVSKSRKGKTRKTSK